MITSINVLTGEITELPDEPRTEVVISELENKTTAILLLQATDWATASDVGNALVSSPYLANQDEFLTYRNEVRQYAVYPVEGDITWPTLPIENWQTV